jgi:hypothetical protein
MGHRLTESWGDAWFLAASHSAGRGLVTLADILGEGDYINHAIFTPAEIDHAVRRLSKAGFLVVEGPDTFRVTSAGHAAVRRSTRALRTWSGVIDGVSTELDAASPTEVSATSAHWTVDTSSYDAAYARYAAKFDADVQRFERLPAPLRTIAMLFWTVIARIWNTFRR